MKKGDRGRKNEIRNRRTAERRQKYAVSTRSRKQARRRQIIPSARIEPNVGVVTVPDERLKVLTRSLSCEKDDLYHHRISTISPAWSKVRFQG